MQQGAAGSDFSRSGTEGQVETLVAAKTETTEQSAEVVAPRQPWEKTQEVPRRCDVVGCGRESVPTSSFDATNVVCWDCGKFSCERCTEQTWRENWGPEEFTKPHMRLPGLAHRLFRCRFCGAKFDQFKILQN